MIRIYLKITWRNLWKNKIFFAINILGLAAGLACGILIFLFIQHELTHDKFHVNAGNIYRVTSIALEGKDRTITVSFQAIRAALANPVNSLRTE